MPPTFLLRADEIFPMDAPPIRDGAIVFRHGLIIAMGMARAMRHDYPDAQLIDAGGMLVLPGLVNAHTHLELSLIPRPPAPRSFVEWIVQLMRAGPDAKSAPAAIEEGVAQCQRFGVTTVGDIGRLCSITRPLLRRKSLNVVSFGEVLAMAQRRHFLEERLAVAADTTEQTDDLRIGISPHAPYSIEADGYLRCAAVARDKGLPLTTHLAETPDEAIFLASHTGAFRELWRILDAWDQHVPKFPGGPIRFAESFGLLQTPSLLAHVNYCDDEELAILARRQASVVYCPRTHDYFGHPPHRWREMLAAGINVALGTDSCASSPDLNLVDDLRLLHAIAPERSAESIFRLATLSGAAALGWSDAVGSITRGKRADFVLFPCQTDDPLKHVLENQILPTSVYHRGTSVRLRLRAHH